MKKILNTWLAGLCFLMTSCGDSHESVVEDYLDIIKEVTEIVKGVNDGDDLSDAIEDINDLKDELEEIAERAEALNKVLSDEERKEKQKIVMEKFDKEVRKIVGDLTAEIAKITTSGTVGAADFVKAAGEFGSTMKW